MNLILSYLSFLFCIYTWNYRIIFLMFHVFTQSFWHFYMTLSCFFWKRFCLSVLVLIHLGLEGGGGSHTLDILHAEDKQLCWRQAKVTPPRWKIKSLLLFFFGMTHFLTMCALYSSRVGVGGQGSPPLGSSLDRNKLQQMSVNFFHKRSADSTTFVE